MPDDFAKKPVHLLAFTGKSHRAGVQSRQHEPLAHIHGVLALTSSSELEWPREYVHTV